ncbi:hypothetical protein LIER_27496 [Lithospermum erythrorhizon]|uniref:Uncharacterized protein n=1 Tax=Lithospermum erythrorhizon TaxID=34254 RepID=A0AAV3RC89_LITER
MVNRSETRMDILEERMSSVQAEMVTMKQELQKIPSIEQGIATLMSRVDQVLKNQERRTEPMVEGQASLEFRKRRLGLARDGSRLQEGQP